VGRFGVVPPLFSEGIPQAKGRGLTSALAARKSLKISSTSTE
jgi:hypothetical protein